MSLRETVIGHKTQKMILQRSLKRVRLSSTYLFSGESGTGKALLAREFVKVLFCESPVETEDGPDSCDRCPQCLKVDHGNHPDLLSLAPEGQQIKIGQIRDAQEYISLRPMEATRRVLIVNEAELMNEAAQNAFLKTLEEPPYTAMIILVTTSPDKLLPTVRSRCFHLRFGLLNTAETEKVLKRLFPEKEPEEIARLARVSMGRPGYVFSQQHFWDPAAAVESLRTGEIVPETKDRNRLMSLVPFYEMLLRDILVKRLTGRSSLFIFPELSGISFSKKLSWKDIIEIYMKIQYIKDISVFNPNVALVGNFLRSQLGALYE